MGNHSQRPGVLVLQREDQHKPEEVGYAGFCGILNGFEMHAFHSCIQLSACRVVHGLCAHFHWHGLGEGQPRPADAHGPAGGDRLCAQRLAPPQSPEGMRPCLSHLTVFHRAANGKRKGAVTDGRCSSWTASCSFIFLGPFLDSCSPGSCIRRSRSSNLRRRNQPTKWDYSQCWVQPHLWKQQILPTVLAKNLSRKFNFPAGSVFIWMFWPSFNSILVDKRTPERDLEVVCSTYLALAASAVAAVAVAVLLKPKGKASLVRHPGCNGPSVRLRTRR